MRLFSVILIMIMSIVFPTDKEIKDPDSVPEEIIDGYLQDNSNENAAKTVESCEITGFSLVFSTLSWADEEYFKEGIYRIEVKKNYDKVSGKYEFTPAYGDGQAVVFDTDESFLIQLDETVKKHDLAGYNGKSIFVSGLPDMYGEELCVEYASGESIYASDNQDGFIPRDAICEIEKLFAKAAGLN